MIKLGKPIASLLYMLYFLFIKKVIAGIVNYILLRHQYIFAQR